MKVTFLCNEKLIDDVREHAKGKTLTDCLTIALTEWVNIQKINRLADSIKTKPLKLKRN